jgi:hypothetical protein
VSLAYFVGDKLRSAIVARSLVVKGEENWH